jgi:hypothetical protein
MLIQVCNTLQLEQPDRFARLPDEFPVKEKPWFTRDGAGAHRPHRFADSGAYLDTAMSTAAKKEFARELLRHFGHGDDEITFQSAKTRK